MPERLNDNRRASQSSSAILGVPRNVGSVAWGEARTRGFATPAFAGCALLELADPRYAVVRRASRTVRGRGFKAEQVCSISSSSYRQPWIPSPWLGRRRFSSCMPPWNWWQSPPPVVLAATWLSWLASCTTRLRATAVIWAAAVDDRQAHILARAELVGTYQRGN